MIGPWPRSAEAIGAPLRGLALAIIASLLVSACTTVTPTFLEQERKRATAEYIFDLVNGYRLGVDLPELRWNESLAQVAGAHATRLAGSGVLLSHRCFEYRVLLVKGLLGDGSVWENVGMVVESQRPAAELLTGWRFSARHREVMLCDAELSGVGVAFTDDSTVYAVQLFYRAGGEEPMIRATHWAIPREHL